MERFAQLGAQDAEASVHTILAAITDAMVQGRRVEIRSLESFTVRERTPRVGRNPKTVERIHVPEKRKAHFKPGKDLRDRVNLSQVAS